MFEFIIHEINASDTNTLVLVITVYINKRNMPQKGFEGCMIE